MIHELKCWPEYFQAVKSGIKPFELRKDDRGFAVGDVLHLREFDPETCTYTGEETNKTVTYVLPTNPFSVIGDGDYVIMGLAPRDWTPCAEGEPENNKPCYVTVKKTWDNGTSNLYVLDGYYAKGSWFDKGGWKINSHGAYPWDCDAIAWKLNVAPEPYRADDTTGKVDDDEFMRKAMYDQLHPNGNEAVEP